MSKKEELIELGKQQALEENALRDEYYKTHPHPKGYGCFEFPGLPEIREKYRKKYIEIQNKYKKD